LIRVSAFSYRYIRAVRLLFAGHPVHAGCSWGPSRHALW